MFSASGFLWVEQHHVVDVVVLDWISHDMTARTHPSHVDVAVQKFQGPFVLLHLFSGNDDAVGGVAGGGAVVFDAMARGHLITNVAFDTISSNDHISFDPFAGVYLNTGLEIGVRFDDFVFEPDVHLFRVHAFEEDGWRSPRWMTDRGALYFSPI